MDTMQFSKWSLHKIIHFRRLAIIFEKLACKEKFWEVYIDLIFLI